MRSAAFLCIWMLAFSVAFAACEFDASKALSEANSRFGWYKNNQNASIAKTLLNGKKAEITVDNVSYYAQLKNGQISQIPPSKTEFSAQLSSCTAVGLWNGSISGKQAIKGGLVKVKANNFFDGILLGVLERFLPN